MEITIALIGFAGAIITTLITAWANRNAMNNRLDITQSVQQNEMVHLKEEIAELKQDIKEHNHYAKLFSETMPVVQEQIKVINHRIDDLEDEK